MAFNMSIPLTATTLAPTQRPTVAIIGGTGKTGKWALKGALVRNYNVRLLARSPQKVDKLLEELFGAERIADEKLKKNLTVVKGSCGAKDGSDIDGLVELFTGADVCLSFLGMVKPPEWVVRPGCESILKAMQRILDVGGKPPKFVSMSSVCLSESAAQGARAWGSCIKCLSLKVMLKNVFLDMQAAEDFLFDMRSEKLNIVVVRASILGDKSKYACDFAEGAAKKYCFTNAEDKKGRVTFTIDRQHVAQAFLDLVEDSTYDNGQISVFEAK